MNGTITVKLADTSAMIVVPMAMISAVGCLKIDKSFAIVHASLRMKHRHWVVNLVDDDAFISTLAGNLSAKLATEVGMLVTSDTEVDLDGGMMLCRVIESLILSFASLSSSKYSKVLLVAFKFLFFTSLLISGLRCIVFFSVEFFLLSVCGIKVNVSFVPGRVW